MPEARYIALEGPIGVGKTSLATLLAEKLSASTVFENVEENPFLKEFYENPRRNAFKAQLFFLLSRYQQQVNLADSGLLSSPGKRGRQTIISDYHFAKDRIFARLNLDEQEMALYEQVFMMLDPRIPRPDLVIYLQAKQETLEKRIRNRGKAYEKGLDTKYLKKVVSAYDDYFFYYNETPLLVINTTKIDFVAREEDLKGLVKEIKEFKSGTQYFVPLGSKG